jgi:hypothetical protein
MVRQTCELFEIKILQGVVSKDHVQAVPAKYEAECTTSETHRWVALDGP